MNARVRRLAARYGFTTEPPPWTGPVVRRDPADYQLPSIILTWRCRGRYCGHWTAPYAHEPTRCNRCGRPRDEVPT